MAISPRDKTGKHQMLLQDFIDGKDFTSLNISQRPDTSEASDYSFLNPPPVAHANCPMNPTAATINVNGTRFDVSQETFCHLAPRLLAMGAKVVPIDSSGGYLASSNTQDKAAHLTKANQVKAQEKEVSFGIAASPPTQEFFVERHAPSFVHILDYFQHGELHLPPDVCPYVFKRELLHWGVDPTVMSDCCQRKYLSFLDDQETLRLFNQSFVGSNYQHTSLSTGKHPSAWSQLRMRAWSLLDDPTSSTWAKIYMTVAVLFVVLSVFVLVASTDNAFKRGLTTDEWWEYFDEDEKLIYGSLLGIDPNKDDPHDDDNHHHHDHHNNGNDGFHDYTLDIEETTETPNATDSPISFETADGTATSETTEASVSHSTNSGQPSGSRRGKRSVGDRYEIPDDPRRVELKKEYERPSAKQEKPNGYKSEGRGTDTPHIEKIRLSYDGESKKTASKHRSLKNIRNLVENLSKALLQFNEVDTNEDGDSPRFSPDEPLDFEIRVMQTSDKSNQDNPENMYIVRNDYAEGDQLTADMSLGNQANGKETEAQENSESEFEYRDYPINEMSLAEDGEIDALLVRHKRSAGNNDNNDTSHSNNNTSTVDSKACYKISGYELGNLLGYAYDTGAATSSSTVTTTTQLPQDVFTVKVWISKIEMICIVYFTLEFLLRLIFCPNKPRFLINFFTIVDILSLGSMYAVLLLHHFNSRTKYTATYVDVINCLQVVRVFRFFRLVKDVTGFRVLIFSVRTSWRELLLLLLYIVMLVTIFASLVYYCERKNMGSILRAAWWAIVTMTTVGYGDIAPTTSLGRFVGAACALSGVLLIAVTVPVFVNNFLLFYEHSKIIDQQVNGPKSQDHPGKEQDDHQQGGGRWERVNSASTTSTSTSFSRQQSTLSTAPTPVESSDLNKPVFSFSNDPDVPRFGPDKSRRNRALSGKGSQVSLTKVQPAA